MKVSAHHVYRRIDRNDTKMNVNIPDTRSAYYWFDVANENDFTKWVRGHKGQKVDGISVRATHDQARAACIAREVSTKVVEVLGSGRYKVKMEYAPALFGKKHEIPLRPGLRFEHERDEWCITCNNQEASKEAETEAYLLSIHESLNLRDKVIVMLGGYCHTCGDDRAHLLHIDHINGDGSVARRVGYVGDKFYKHVAEVGLGLYQLLCPSCNWDKRFKNGEGPRRRKFDGEAGNTDE